MFEIALKNKGETLKYEQDAETKTGPKTTASDTKNINGEEENESSSTWYLECSMVLEHICW